MPRRNTFDSQTAGHCELFSERDCALNRKKNRCLSVISGQGDGQCICSENGICVKLTTVQGLRAKVQKLEREFLREREINRRYKLRTSRTRLKKPEFYR